ncbi:hypothetical protein L1887_11162 [Cichorium endivia]|nr:hypothetical protein L1887_11162 [Cichorium endivia]
MEVVGVAIGRRRRGAASNEIARQGRREIDERAMAGDCRKQQLQAGDACGGRRRSSDGGWGWTTSALGVGEVIFRPQMV